MAERQGAVLAGSGESAGSSREHKAAIVSLVSGALIWGLIWYPYRILRDAGIDGILAPTITYSLAFVIGLVFFRRWTTGLAFSWPLVGLALAAAGWPERIGYAVTIHAPADGGVVAARMMIIFR